MGQTFPSAALASRIRRMDAGERLEREDVDASLFHLPPSKPVSHFTPFSDQYWPCLRVGRRDKHGFLKQLLAIGHGACELCVSLQRDPGGLKYQEEKGTRKPFPSLTSSVILTIPSFMYLLI